MAGHIRAIIETVTVGKPARNIMQTCSSKSISANQFGKSEEYSPYFIGMAMSDGATGDGVLAYRVNGSAPDPIQIRVIDQIFRIS
jgi:hypothetical protein